MDHLQLAQNGPRSLVTDFPEKGNNRDAHLSCPQWRVFEVSAKVQADFFCCQ